MMIFSEVQTEVLSTVIVSVSSGSFQDCHKQLTLFDDEHVRVMPRDQVLKKIVN